jgi:hypothetical protein
MPNSNFTPGSLLDEYPPDHFLLLNPKLSTNPAHRRTLSSINTQTPGASRNSSLQKVWAEDYYNIDYSSEGEYTDQGLREAAGGQHPFEGTLPAQEREHSPARPSRTQQRSLTSLLPFQSPTRTNSKSPERQSPKREVDDFMPTFTGDKEGVIKLADKSKGLTSWFTGSSAPVALGIPDESLQPNMTNIRETSPARGSPRTRPNLPTIDSSSSMNTTPQKNASAASRFTNFFSSPKTPSRTNTVQVPAGLNSNEFLTLDVESALFPAGPPYEQDSFSPSSFKNLEQNARGLLFKLHNAYKLRTVSLHEVTAEKEAMAEELEESQTKMNLLKTNISSLAQQVSERDETIQELMNELNKEKQARANEKEARERSIAIVTARAQREAAKRGSTSDLSIDTTAEDLGISSARWKRQSGGTDFTEGDSDAESGAGESTFSRARSPVHSIAGTVDSMPTVTPEIMQASFARMVPNPTHTSGFEKRPKMVQQKSTFQKVLGKINSSESDDTVMPTSQDPYGGLGMGEHGCSNCQGKDASVAWDTVGLIRAENKGLKERVGELEKAVEDTLDLPFMMGLQSQ